MAHETADVVLLGNDLVRLVDTLKVARRTHGIIWQNFAGTIIVDLAGIILASIGLFGPLLAAFIHVASELPFILNLARLLPHRAQVDSGVMTVSLPPGGTCEHGFAMHGNVRIGSANRLVQGVRTH